MIKKAIPSVFSFLTNKTNWYPSNFPIKNCLHWHESNFTLLYYINSEIVTFFILLYHAFIYIEITSKFKF